MTVSFSGMMYDLVEKLKYFFTKKTSLFIDHTLQCTVSREIKIGIISDIEGAIDEAKRSAKKLKKEDVECIIVAGDTYENDLIRFSPLFPEKNKVKQMIEGLTPFAELNVPMYVIPGNHERKEYYMKALRLLRKKHKKVKDLNQKLITNKEYAIYGFGGCFDFMIVDPDGFIPTTSDYEKAKKTLQKIKNKPILFITHVPPKSRDDIDLIPGQEHIGDREIRKLMTCAKNIVNLHGHIHEQGGQFSYYKSNIAINVASITPYRNYRGSNTAILRLFNNKVLYEEL